MKFGSPDSRRSTSTNFSSKRSEMKWVSVSTYCSGSSNPSSRQSCSSRARPCSSMKRNSTIEMVRVLSSGAFAGVAATGSVTSRLHTFGDERHRVLECVGVLQKSQVLLAERQVGPNASERRSDRPLECREPRLPVGEQLG